MGVKRKRTRPQQSASHSNEPESSSDDASDYEIVAGNDDDEPDIASALTGFAPDDDEDDDIEGLIRSHQAKQNVKAGAEAVKRSAKAQSKPGGSSAVGGGSFQSMGECSVYLLWLSRNSNISKRPSSFAPSIPRHARIQNTHSHPASLHPFPSCLSPS